MEVLTLQQAGYIAWSKLKKNKTLFATASLYDSFNPAENAQDDALLQLYSFDIVNKTSSSQKLGAASYEGAHFTSIDWENFGEGGNFPYGVIATGFDNGVVGLWDPSKIIQTNPNDNSADINQRGLISLQEVHDSSVNTIAFNPFRQHLIASGGTEVAVHNLEKNINEPDVFSPGDDVHQKSLITSVSWNRKVPHILGSASQNGISVVWDLKLNKAIFNFSDPSRVASNRNVCLSWNPEIPTQIAVVYDDIKVPELQIWDLRNPKGPIFCTVKGHTKGIHYLDWSITDPSLIVTLGRDNKVCIWNYKMSSDNLVSEFNVDEPSTQVKWSPKQPEIYSVSAASGKSTIYSLNNQLDHIPAWIRPPVGARFSFDGRLTVFSEKGGNRVKEFKVKASNEEIEPYIQELEKSLETANINLDKLCQNRIDSTLLHDIDREEWTFIQAIAKNDPDSIIEALGFNKDQIIKKAENYTGKSYVTKSSNTTANKKVESNFKNISAEEAEDFFGNLGRKGSKDNIPAQGSDSMVELPDEYAIQETVIKNTNWNAGTEKIIKSNILVGNIEGAVDAALKCGRVAEALLLAYYKGGDFYRSTIKSYVTSCNDAFVKNVIRYLVEDQIEELVLNYSLDDWKECVALCLTLSQKGGLSFKDYMEQLASRFINERSDYDTAVICYILSKDFLRIIEVYQSHAEKFNKGSVDYTVFLMNTVEKIVALKIITNYQAPNPVVDRFLYEISKVLYINNRGTLIMNLLAANSSSGFENLAFQDRLLNSSLEFQQLYAPKSFPFHRETVNVKAKKHKIEPGRKEVTHAPVEDVKRQVPGQVPGQIPSGPVKKIQPAGQPGARPPFGQPSNPPISQPLAQPGHLHAPVQEERKTFEPPKGPTDFKMPRPAEQPTRNLFDPTKKKEETTAPPFGGPPKRDPLPVPGPGPRDHHEQHPSQPLVTPPKQDPAPLNKFTPFSGAPVQPVSEPIPTHTNPPTSTQPKVNPPPLRQPPPVKGPGFPRPGPVSGPTGGPSSISNPLSGPGSIGGPSSISGPGSGPGSLSGPGPINGASTLANGPGFSTGPPTGSFSGPPPTTGSTLSGPPTGGFGAPKTNPPRPNPMGAPIGGMVAPSGGNQMAPLGGSQMAPLGGNQMATSGGSMMPPPINRVGQPGPPPMNGGPKFPPKMGAPPKRP